VAGGSAHRGAGAGIQAQPYGYCTEFLLEGEGLPVAALREAVQRAGDSVIVAGDDRRLRVHVHTFRPGAVLELASDHGVLSRIKIDNMTDQHAHFEAPAGDIGAIERTGAALGVVAVAAGPGIGAALADLGAVVVSGGHTMNPSAEDLLEGIRRADAAHTLVLPNHPNVIMAARQAAALAGRPVRVVPTRSAPQGLAALLGMSPEEALEPNAARMQAAADAVRTVAVIRAVREAVVDGRTVAAGDVMALLDERLAGMGASPVEAVAEAVTLVEGEVVVVTLIAGAAAEPQTTDALAALLEARWPGSEVARLAGGQPHADWIIGLE
jgi:dihydroxyacetone kinase-like predicted kinase